MEGREYARITVSHEIHPTGMAWMASSKPEPMDEVLVRRVCQVFLRDCERVREGCGVWGGLSNIQFGVRRINPVWLITGVLFLGACVKGVDTDMYRKDTLVSRNQNESDHRNLLFFTN